jgi:hypothetical protein
MKAHYNGVFCFMTKMKYSFYFLNPLRYILFVIPLRYDNSSFITYYLLLLFLLLSLLLFLLLLLLLFLLILLLITSFITPLIISTPSSAHSPYHSHDSPSPHSPSHPKGAEFGRLIANQILRSFIESYPEADFTHVRDISQFSSFNNKLVEAISQTARSILQQRILSCNPYTFNPIHHFTVKNSRGISNALLILDDGNTHSTSSGLDDQLGIVANLQAMLAFANDIMLSKEDRPRLITLDMMRQTVLVHRIGPSSLVCVCRKNRDPATYRDKIATAVSLLEKLFQVQVCLFV